MVDGADNAAGQEQGDEDEQAAEDEEPEFRRDGGEGALAEIHQQRPDDRADQRAAAADRRPDDDLDGIDRGELAGIDDADLRHVEGAGNAGHHRRDGEGEELHMLGPPADEAGTAFGVAHGHHQLAEPRAGDPADDDHGHRQRDAAGGKEAGAGGVGLQREAEQFLEVGQAVIAAEPHVVAKEGQQQRIGHRLGDDRQIDAGDAAAEGEIAEDEGEDAGGQHDHQRGEPELVEAVPVPGQLLPVQEHHEVRQHRVAIDPARADLAHQIHAHGVAAEGEEGAMAERQDADIAPDQIEGERQERVADIFAEERHRIGRHMQRMAGRQPEIGQRHEDRRRQDHGDEDEDAGTEEARENHASTNLPFWANRPRGRFWMKRMIRTSTMILPRTAPA